MTEKHVILFVDDEQMILDVLAQTFADDYEVLTAGSGADALELLRTRGVDLLVTDQRMPGMSGVQLITHARELIPDLTSVLLTAYTDPPDIIDAINRGRVYRFVTKPYDLQDLTLTIQSALREVRLRRENAQLLADAQRRLAALQVVHEVSRAAASLSRYADIVDRVSELLERVVPLDVSATLLLEGEQRATVTVRPRAGAPELDLSDFKYDVLEHHRTLTQRRLQDADLRVRVTGRPQSLERSAQPQREVRVQSRAFIPLRVDGKLTGVLAVGAIAEGAFTPDDERVLDLLANQMSDAIAALTKKLDADRRRAQAMLEGVSEGLALLDPAGQLLSLNGEAKRLLRVDDMSEVTPLMLSQAIGGPPFEVVREWERIGPQALHRESELQGRALAARITPLLEDDGGLAGIAVALRDSVQDREAEERRDDFISFVTHEMRTPLTSISGTLDLLLENRMGDLRDDQRRYVSLAKSGVAQMNALIGDLLDLAQVKRGRLKLELESASLDDIVATAVEQSRAAFERRKIALGLTRSKGGAKALVDRKRMLQVVGNLLTNALKFTSESGEVRVAVHDVGDVGETVGFSVWNNGGHIDPAEQDRIFDKFEQGKKGIESAVRGTGLGLAISRSIVVGHGGHIWVESAPNRGACFIVMLPLEGVNASGETSVSVSGPAVVPRADRPLVLLAEHDADTGFALKALLLRRGYRVTLVHSGEEAIAAGGVGRPACVVLDLHLPDIEGARVMEILRHDSDTRGVPLLVLGAPEDGLRAMHAGADDFLPRPIDSSRLLASLATSISGVRDGKRVLLVDDDPQFRALCAEVLSAHGLNVAQAATAAAAREMLRAFRADIVLLDVNLPDRDGFRLFQDLKADITTSQIAVIFVSARGDIEDKVHALRLGGDDYLVKPFEHKELVARVETVLRRRELDSAASPTTRLPGGVAIEREVARRLDQKQAFTLCYLDLDNLKAFNDFYGYAKADGVIRQTGDLLREVMATFGKPGDFVGHIAGDDFVFVTAPESADELCKQTIAAFDRVIPLYYSREDRKRGYIEAEDRYGKVRNFPIMSISIVSVTDPGGRYRSHADLAVAAAGLKKRAKAVQGSVYIRDDDEEVASA